MNHAATATAQRKTVTIEVKDGKIIVDPEPFRISKELQEEVIWNARDGVYFTVEFSKESPFYESQFNSEFSASGLVRREVLADPQKKYEYTIRAGGVTRDPGGVITR